eukprot:CAMPEP_0175088660 /NCGR_PEP_ID=MMETSP0086_2-20121207/365_1 /TAXON_ID=136419 /ORGANISM="Unknown Unknown, Strain D1" /LENGTH=410 /DNA_ID=CAMNT_0016361105 /DNA_START=24 /DNA_END=1256 /DNA_ORIENTATION=-
MQLEAGPQVQQEVMIALQLPGEVRIEKLCSNNLTLWEMLQAFEQQFPKHNLTTHHGIPEPEINSMFEIHINRPGYLQPTLEFTSRIIDSVDELKSLRLSGLGISKGCAELRFAYKYIAPQIDEREAKSVIDTFNEKFSAATNGNKDYHAISDNNANSKFSGFKAGFLNNSASKSTKKSASTPPKLLDRQIRVWLGNPGRIDLSHYDEPDEFYDVSQEEQEEYSKKVQAEAEAFRKGQVFVSGTSSKSRKEFKFARIRFRLPGMLLLEMTFLPTETIRTLHEELKKVLKSPFDFYLYIAPPRQVLNKLGTKLVDAGLVPSSIINVGSTNSDNPWFKDRDDLPPDYPVGFLRDDLGSAVTVMNAQQVSSTTNARSHKKPQQNIAAAQEPAAAGQTHIEAQQQQESDPMFQLD